MKYLDYAIDWKQAVIEGCLLLAENNLATMKLADAIFAQTEVFGAYYVLEKGIALLHAPVGDYSLGMGLSLLVLQENIIFNNQPEKQARIIFTLVTPNNHAHIHLLEKLGAYFSDEAWKKQLLATSNWTDFKNLIKGK